MFKVTVIDEDQNKIEINVSGIGECWTSAEFEFEMGYDEFEKFKLFVDSYYERKEEEFNETA